MTLSVIWHLGWGMGHNDHFIFLIDTRTFYSGNRTYSLMTADLCDHYLTSPERLSILEPNLLQSYGLKASFHGKIETVSCFESNPIVRETLESPGMGRVLVVDAGSSARCAVLGDKLAALAVQNNWAGIVINGFIRDSKVINGMDVGIKAIGTHPLKSSKSYQGVRGCRCNFGGVEFVPGYWLYSDEDGIIISKDELTITNELDAV